MNKQVLYESIMSDIAKLVKKRLNEHLTYEDTLKIAFDDLIDNFISSFTKEIYDYIEFDSETGLYSTIIEDINGDLYRLTSEDVKKLIIKFIILTETYINGDDERSFSPVYKFIKKYTDDIFVDHEEEIFNLVDMVSSVASERNYDYNATFCFIENNL